MGGALGSKIQRGCMWFQDPKGDASGSGEGCTDPRSAGRAGCCGHVPQKQLTSLQPGSPTPGPWCVTAIVVIYLD